MTTRWVRDVQRLLADEAASYGGRVRVEYTGSNHLRAIISVGASEIPIVCSLTPSSWSSGRKIRANARRALRNLAT
jgi:hypothetical protein